MVDTPEQRFSRVRDSVELALEDWERGAGFDEADEWPRRWAKEYVARARDEVGGWLKGHGVRFCDANLGNSPAVLSPRFFLF